MHKQYIIYSLIDECIKYTPSALLLCCVKCIGYSLYIYVYIYINNIHYTYTIPYIFTWQYHSDSLVEVQVLLAFPQCLPRQGLLCNSCVGLEFWSHFGTKKQMKSCHGFFCTACYVKRYNPKAAAAFFDDDLDEGQRLIWIQDLQSNR